MAVGCDIILAAFDILLAVFDLLQVTLVAKSESVRAQEHTEASWAMAIARTFKSPRPRWPYLYACIVGQLDTIYGDLADSASENSERLEEQWSYTLRLGRELLVEVWSFSDEMSLACFDEPSC